MASLIEKLANIKKSITDFFTPRDYKAGYQDGYQDGFQRAISIMTGEEPKEEEKENKEPEEPTKSLYGDI